MPPLYIVLCACCRHSSIPSKTLKPMLRPARVLLMLLLTFTAGLPAVLASDAFPRPAELEPDIAFWRRIYTEVGTDGGVIHDPVRLDVVYEVMKFPDDLSPRERSKRIDDTKKKYSRILDRLASGATDLSDEEQRVQALWPKGTRRARFEQAAEEVRFQLGQSDRFREGVIRSGAYRDHIAATFEKMGLPRELAALPHVESSFNTYAYSKVGAAGMWQFMRGTGRRFMRIDSVVDERLDPYRATEAAGTFPRAELHRAGQLAAGADGLQPRHCRHASRAGADGHERHRDHRAQVQQPLVRLRLAQFLRRVPRGAGDRRRSGEVLRSDQAQSGRQQSGDGDGRLHAGEPARRRRCRSIATCCVV